MSKVEDLQKELEDLKAKVGSLPVMQEAAALQATKEERLQKARELAELKAARPAVMEKIAEKQRKADELLKKAREGLKSATAEWNKLSGEAWAEAWGFDQKILEAEAFLRDSAPVSLRTQLQKLESKREEIRTRHFSEREILPDVSPDQFVDFYDSEGGRTTGKGGPLLWWKKHFGPSNWELRLKELQECEAGIQGIQDKILSGGE